MPHIVECDTCKLQAPDMGPPWAYLQMPGRMYTFCTVTCLQAMDFCGTDHEIEDEAFDRLDTAGHQSVIAKLRLTQAIHDEHVSHSRSFYAPGALARSAIVITVTRVSDEEYRALADGKSDAIMRVEPNVDD